MMTVLGIILAIIVVFLGLQVLTIQKMRAKRGKEAPQLGGKLDEQMRRGKAMLYFYSPGCRACRPMTPVVKNLARQDDRIFLEDVSRDIHAAQKFGVMATPTVILVDEGKIAEVLVGYQDEARLRALLAD